MPKTRLSPKTKRKEFQSLIVLAIIFAVLFILTIVISSQVNSSRKTGQLFDNQSRASERFTFCRLIGDRQACEAKDKCAWYPNTNGRGSCKPREDGSGGGGGGGTTPAPTPTPAPTAPPAPQGNVFGVMMGNASKVPSAVTLGARYYRPSAVFADEFTGNCAECNVAVQNGLKLVLTVRANKNATSPQGTRVTTPVTDLNQYKQQLTSVINLYPPEVLVIENEENSNLFYTGTPSQYHEELRAGCKDVADARGIPCTNGGLVSTLVSLLVADDYMTQGKRNEAISFLNRTYQIKVGDTSPANPERILSNTRNAEQVARGKALLAGYTRANGLDYVNFHWYFEDTQALGEAKVYMERVTGLPAMTNEVGQQGNQNPDQVTNVMTAIKGYRMPYAIWYSIDTNAFGEASSLVNSDGSLRPNGQAFKNFIEANY